MITILVPASPCFVDSFYDDFFACVIWILWSATWIAQCPTKWLRHRIWYTDPLQLGPFCRLCEQPNTCRLLNCRLEWHSEKVAFFCHLILNSSLTYFDSTPALTHWVNLTQRVFYQPFCDQFALKKITISIKRFPSLSTSKEFGKLHI